MLGLVTYKSVEKLGWRLFRRCLESSLQVPYKAVILVDDSPDPDTRAAVVEFAYKYDKELVVFRSRLYGHHRPTRATARQTVIDVFLENFSEPWLFFLDDDAYLREGWWEEAKPHMASPRVGLIWGINWDATPDRLEYLKFFGIDYRRYLVRAFEGRGGLHDTLIRREALEGIRIPPELHVLEDGYVKWWVQCRGWEIRILETGITHYNPWRPEDMYRNMETLGESIRVAWRYGIADTVFGPDLHKEYRGILKPALGVLRPIGGFFVFLPKALRTVGLKSHFYRQALKLKNRAALFWTRLRQGPPPHPCQVICDGQACP